MGVPVTSPSGACVKGMGKENRKDGIGMRNEILIKIVGRR
jgi:hypothetical protein